MKRILHIRRVGCAFFCICLLCAVLCLCTAADSIRSYSVTLEVPANTTAKNTPVILNDQSYARDQTMTLAGWVRTDHPISHYLYTLDGGKTWIRADGVRQRDDLKSICPSTYKTAGFHFDVDLSGLSDGKYDLFVRGITTSGDEIAVLAMLDASYGYVDSENAVRCEINLARLGGSNTLSLTAGNTVVLGTYALSNYKSIELIADDDVTLTLNATDPYALGSFSLVLSDAKSEKGKFYYTADLTQMTYAGELSLSADQDTRIHAIRLYCNTPDYYQGDMLIRMTYAPFEYLGSMNQATAGVYSDDTVGTYTRLKSSGNGNDPYVYFNIRSYLKENLEYEISADHYRYAVITVQTPPENSPGQFRLFLCAGAIRGPSGNSHIAFQPINDGEWHRYVIPLYLEDDWLGQIHGVRFDFIDAHVKSTDYANIASIGFYPDEKSAQEAAAQPFEAYYEEGDLPQIDYEEQGRAPSGRADAVTWFDDSMLPCFSGHNRTEVSFDQYGHLFLRATEDTNDPYVTFDLRPYAELTKTELLDAQQHQTIVLRVLADKEIEGTSFALYYHAGGFDYAAGERSIGATYSGGEWEYLVYDMTDKPMWTDQILGLRLDYSSQISAGQQVCVSDILFFADMDAWREYAAQNGIDLPEDPFVTPLPDRETEPVTQAPTIEIPTQGPGLEYVPPEQMTTPGTSDGCNGIIALPMLLSIFTLVIFAFYNKKGERS